MRSLNAVPPSIACGQCQRVAFTSAIALVLMGCASGGGGSAGGVQQSTQTITFTQPTSPVTYTPTLSIALSATGGGSGNPVTFSIDSSSTSKGTITGSTVTGITAGKLVIDANQAGSTNYSAAPQVSVTVMVNQAAPTVSAWPTASAITSGQALSASTLTGGMASTAGSFAWTTPSTVPATGTDSESVTFTPTDATDYMSVTADVSIVVNPTTPQIASCTPRSIVSDNYLYNLSSTPTYTFTGTGWQNGDILHDASGLSSDLTLSLSSGQTSFGENFQWQPGTYQPWFLTWEMQHPGGAYGNQCSSAFFGSASQSTFACSPTTGRCFQDEQSNGQIYWQDTNGATGIFYPSNENDTSPSLFAVDDVTGNVVSIDIGTNTLAPGVSVNGQAGWTNPVCYLTPTGMSFISSIAARGGYMVFTDPVDNLVGMAKMDCTGYQTISSAGQPWSVAMVNTGTEVDADVLFRDAWAADGNPGVVKYIVPAMTKAGSVELSIPTITSIRSTTPLEGIRQIVAVTNTQVAILSMSNQTDGEVLLVSTDTSSGKAMAVTNTVQVPELPFALAAQQAATTTTLWVAYIDTAGGDNVTYAGTIDPTTGDFTPAIGTCPAGILAGGFAASATQVYCAQGSVIDTLHVTPRIK